MQVWIRLRYTKFRSFYTPQITKEIRGELLREIQTAAVCKVIAIWPNEIWPFLYLKLYSALSISN